MIPVIDQRKEAIIARAKLAKLTEHCAPACPGWAVFEASSGLEVEACDECWHGVPDRLTDSEASALPEAIELLMKESTHQGIALSVWQRSLGYEGLPKLTDAEARALESKLRKAFKRMESAS